MVDEQFRASLLAYASSLSAFEHAAGVLAGAEGKSLQEHLASVRLLLMPDASPGQLARTAPIVEEELDAFATERAGVHRRQEHEYQQIIRIVAEAGAAMAESGVVHSRELMNFASKVETISRLNTIREARNELTARVSELKAIGSRIAADGEAGDRCLADKLRRTERLKQAEMKAETDVLTGLGNRRNGKYAIADALARGGPVSILVLDLNGFKQINDTYGHNQGDKLLQAVAQGLRRAVRDCDRVCRWGGDEFVVLLPGPTLEI